MQKILLLIASLIFVPMALANQAYQGNCTTGNTKAAISGMTSSNTLMASYPQCTVSVYIHGTTTPATIYADNNSSPTPLANPFTATNDGSFFFYAGSGEYDVTMSGGLNGGFPAPVTISDVVASGIIGDGTTGQFATYISPTTIGGHTLVAADINALGAITNSTSGNAATATALAATPTQCSGSTPLVKGVAANGNANCSGTLAVQTLSVNSIPYQSPEVALQALQIQRAASQDYDTNTTTTFNDGSCYPWAAASYNNVYISDFSLHVLRRPQSTTTTCISNILTKFLSQVSTPTTPNPSTYSGGVGNTPSVSGSIPIALLQNGLPVAYCSAWDEICKYSTGDGWIFAPLLENLYYSLVHDSTQMVHDLPIIETALSAVPTDPTTGLPNITKYVSGSTPLGSEWVCWAFMEKARFTGNVTNCSAWYYQDAVTMASMYGVVGNSTLQAKWQAVAAKVQANMGAASPLWNASLGVYNAATGQNAQPDLVGTSLACHYGLATAAQCNSFSSYLVSNYSALFYYGYARQSNANWATVGYITPTGAYSATDSESQPGCYQDGYWSMAGQEIAEALNRTSPARAQEMLAEFTNGPDLTMEFWSVPTATCARMNGSTDNLESPAGMSEFAAEYPSLVVESYQQLHAWIGGGNFTPDATVAGPSSQVSATVGNNALDSVNRFDTTVNATHCATTGGIETATGFCAGMRKGYTSYSMYSRGADTGAGVGTPANDSMTVDPVTGLPSFPGLRSANAFLYGTGNLTILSQNELVSPVGGGTPDQLINPALPGIRIALTGSNTFLIQTAPAATGTPAWATVGTINASGDLLSTHGYSIMAPSATTTGTCTPNGYLTASINGTTVHIATCP